MNQNEIIAAPASVLRQRKMELEGREAEIKSELQEVAMRLEYPLRGGQFEKLKRRQTKHEKELMDVRHEIHRISNRLGVKYRNNRLQR